MWLSSAKPTAPHRHEPSSRIGIDRLPPSRDRPSSRSATPPRCCGSSRDAARRRPARARRQAEPAPSLRFVDQRSGRRTARRSVIGDGGCDAPAEQGAEGHVGRVMHEFKQRRAQVQPGNQGQEPQAGDRHRSSRSRRLARRERREEQGQPEAHQGPGAPGRDRIGRRLPGMATAAPSSTKRRSAGRCPAGRR